MPEVSLYTMQKQGGWWVVRRSILFAAEDAAAGRFRPRRGRTQVGAGAVIRGDEADYYLRRGVASVDAVRFAEKPSAAQVDEVVSAAAREMAEEVDALQAAANIRGVTQKKRISYKFMLGRFLAAARGSLMDAIWRGASDPAQLKMAIETVRREGYLSAEHVQIASCVGYLMDRMADDPIRFERSVSLALLVAGLAAAGHDKPGRKRIAGYKVEALVTAALLAEAAAFSGEYAILKVLKDSAILGKVRRYRRGVDDLCVSLAVRYRERGDKPAVALLERLRQTPLAEFVEDLRRMEAEDAGRYRAEYKDVLERILENAPAEIGAVLVLDEIYSDRSFLRARNESARIAKYLYWGIRHLVVEAGPESRVPPESRMLGNLRHYMARRADRVAFPVAGRGTLGVLPLLRTRSEVDAFLDTLEAFDREGEDPSGDRELPSKVRQAVRDYVKDREIMLETRLFDRGRDALQLLRGGLEAAGEVPADLPRRLYRLLMYVGPLTPRWAEAARRMGRPADFTDVEMRLRHDAGMAEFRFVQRPVFQRCRTSAGGRIVRLLGGEAEADELLARVEAAGAELMDRAFILIVEDDPAIRFIEETAMQGAGYRVRSAPGWLDGSRIILDEPVDLMILDLALPDLNGLEILKRIRAEPTTRRMPVLVVSAMDRKDIIMDAVRLGASDYVVKPFEVDTLLAKIQVLLEGVPRGP